VLDAEESREEESKPEVVEKKSSKQQEEVGGVPQQLKRVNILGKPVDDGSE
jgi:hypothetical protein